MKLYIARHGETAWNVENKVSGRTDVPLTERGLQQAQELAGHAVGKGSEVIQNIDMVGADLDMGQGMCGSSSGSIPTNVGQPLIRVSTITVGVR